MVQHKVQVKVSRLRLAFEDRVEASKKLDACMGEGVLDTQGLESVVRGSINFEDLASVRSSKYRSPLCSYSYPPLVSV